jgi:hypothetical protein
LFPGILDPIIVNGWQGKIFYEIAPKSVLHWNHPACLGEYVLKCDGI